MELSSWEARGESVLLGQDPQQCSAGTVWDPLLHNVVVIVRVKEERATATEQVHAMALAVMPAKTWNVSVSSETGSSGKDPLVTTADLHFFSPL